MVSHATTCVCIGVLSGISCYNIAVPYTCCSVAAVPISCLVASHNTTSVCALTCMVCFHTLGAIVTPTCIHIDIMHTMQALLLRACNFSSMSHAHAHTHTHSHTNMCNDRQNTDAHIGARITCIHMHVHTSTHHLSLFFH